MAFPHSHKTVLVLDRSPHFLRSSKQSVEFDVFTKSRTPGIIPLAPIVKSLWTCNVEAAIEYCRIVYDVYPQDKLIRLVLSDTVATTVNSWEHQEQNIQKLMLTLARHGPPSQAAPGPNENNIINGLTEAVELLCQPSETQHAQRTSMTDSSPAVINRGRIICITSVKSESHIHVIEDCMQDALMQHNNLAASTDNLMPLSHLELVLVHVVPVSHESAITHKAGREISSHLWSEVHVSQSGRFIATKMVELSMQHFQLSCTTVTGIPMKEEQNASSSANYDVELLHSRLAHLEVSRSGVGAVEGMIMPSKEGLFIDTVTLKWCTPRTNAVELHPCHGAFRITPVDVNSRPSSCLTNFLLNGRSVMLEQPRKTANKVISHMLTSHGGEIYIHILMTSRSILEDPPSISEGSGGRITDYRINDFGEMMRHNWLAPVSDISGFEELPIERARSQLERETRHWPLVISETIIFNLLPIHPLPSVLTKETLTETDSLECKKAIYRLVSMESHNEPLPVQPSGTRGKGPKREEQYRQMWAELEKFVRAHAGSSSMHQRVLDCVLDCKRPSPDDGRGGSPGAGGDDRKPSLLELEQAAWKELDRFQKVPPERKDIHKVEIKSPESPPPVKRPKTEKPHGLSRRTGNESLLSMWTSRLKSQHSNRHAEFAGRAESSGHKADLYIHMNDNPKGDTKNGGIQGKTNGNMMGKLGSSAGGGQLKKY